MPSPEDTSGHGHSGSWDGKHEPAYLCVWVWILVAALHTSLADGARQQMGKCCCLPFQSLISGKSS
mgnify:CR=1 FL=1